MALHRRLEVLGYALIGGALIWSFAGRERPASVPVAAPVEVTPIEYPRALEPLFASSSASRWVRWCDVDRVLEQKCRRCHRSPGTSGAPFPLSSYEDTQRDYPPGSGQKISERMLRAVRHRIMPPTALPIEPAVLALDAAEADVLIVWLEEGALRLGPEVCTAERP